MADPATDSRSPAERVVGRDLDQSGRAFTSRQLGSERSIEAYMRAQARPRWMERLMEIEAGTRAALRELERAHAQLGADCGHDPVAFARRWAQVAAEWDFGELNELIRTHNDWYPVERDLPMNPRTGEYLLIGGRSYRRRELDAGWVLERFPAVAR